MMSPEGPDSRYLAIYGLEAQGPYRLWIWGPHSTARRYLDPHRELEVGRGPAGGLSRMAGSLPQAMHLEAPSAPENYEGAQVIAAEFLV